MAKPEPQHETNASPRSIPTYVIVFTGIIAALLAFGVWSTKRKPGKPKGLKEPTESRKPMAKSEPQYETRGVWPSVPTYAILFMAAFVTAGAFGVWGLVYLQWPAPPPRPSPFANEAQPIGSAPSLQINPEADLARLNRRMKKRLHSVGWVNRSAGIVHMPIDRAMDLLVKRESPDTAFRAPNFHKRQAQLTQNAD